jgi:hypothetical protein
MPPEIFGQILSLVVKGKPGVAASYATISRKWQPFMERHTFRNLRLDQDRIKEAWKIMTLSRQEYVQELRMDVMLPEYETEPQPCPRETVAEQTRNSQVFTDAIMSLFEILASWSSSASRKGICLRMHAYSPTDLSSEKPRKNWLGVNHKLTHRWEGSYLDLLSSSSLQLPAIAIVSALYFNESIRHRNFAPKALCKITARFPNLHSLGWWFRDSELYDIRWRMETRQQLTAGLASLPRFVRRFTLFCQRDHCSDGSDWNPTNLCPNGSASDPLNLAIFQLSQQLEFLRLDHVTIGTEALWPGIVPVPTSQPESNVHFPRLRVLQMNSNIVSPSGEWLLLDSGSGFREVAEPGLVNSYCLAAARAAIHMPSLRRLKLGWHVWGPYISYMVSEGEAKAILTYSGVPPFDLSDKVKDAWHEVTRARVGNGEAMTIKWIEKRKMEPAYDHEQIHPVGGFDNDVVLGPPTNPELFRGFSFQG